MDDITLRGRHVRLEPLGHHHLAGLLAASAADPSLYDWTLVAQDEAGMRRYIDTALAMKASRTAMPFAIVRQGDGMVLGSTRFFDLARWPWPESHARYGRTAPDAGEIGYTWLTRSAVRTPVNTEAKLMLLTHAFETWGMLGVCLHTDVRNDRSRAAIERLGAKFEGVLRAHRMASDYTPRDSARYSITAPEWPAVKERLTALASR